MNMGSMRLKPFPHKLNTFDDAGLLKPDECVENYNLMVNTSGNLQPHWQWTGQSFAGVTKIYDGILYEPKSGAAQLVLVYADSNYQICIGKVEKDDTTVTKIYNYTIGKYYIPQLIKHSNKIYILNGTGDQEDEQRYTLSYNGEEVKEITTLPPASCGCSFRGRLFLAGMTGEWLDSTEGGIPSFYSYKYPGKMYYTEIGVDTIDGSYEVGNIEELVSAMYASKDRILIWKENELWEFFYADNVSIDTSILRKRSSNAGTLNHNTIQGHFDICYSYNSRGIFILNPGTLNISKEQLIEVDPGIVDITRAITPIFQSLNLNTKSEEEYSKDTFSYGDFSWWNWITFYEDGDFFGIEPGQAIGQGRSNSIDLPSGYKWDKIYFKFKFDNQYIETQHLYIRLGYHAPATADLRVTDLLESTEFTWHPDGYTGDYTMEIADTVKDAATLKWYVRLETTSSGASPKVDKVIVTAKPIIADSGSGFYRDRFYIFSGNTSDTRVNLAFKDGWMRVKNNTYDIYNLCDEVNWDSSFSFIGFGRDSDMGNGVLLKQPIPEITTGTMTIQGKTGELYFDTPDVPKKLRNIFITYKGTGTIYLKIYGEQGLLETITLVAKTDFFTREINMRTERSKWFQFEITSTNADFFLNDFKADVKTFKPNEL